MKEKLRCFLTAYEQEIAQSAEEMREAPIPELTEELFDLFEKTGNRIQYENVYFRRRKFLAVYGMAVFLWKRPGDICRLCEILWEICKEFCWALPAHVDRRKEPDIWRKTLDLFACETGFALAEIGIWCREALPGELREQMRCLILERVIVPFEKSPVPCGWWENCDHNWNAVCGGSIGCTAIYLLREEPARRDRILRRIQASLTHYVEGFSEDGACMEGVGYFTYGMSFYAAFADQLLELTEGKGDLMAGEKMKKIMEFQQKCYFPGGCSISFSDSSPNEKFRVGLTCFLAERDPDVTFPDMRLAAGLNADSCYRWAVLFRDYVFTKRYLEAPSVRAGERAVLPQEVQTTLPGAQWTICRGAWESAMAAKGGHNGEPHNHNDVGSFHYVVGRELFLADLGAGEYTREYFRDETRYEIFVNQSLSHNLPVINGYGQKPGREKNCSFFFTDGQGHTELNAENAYGDPALKSFSRILDFLPEEGTLRVRDSFWGREALTVLENLVTPILPDIQGNQVILAGKEHTCRLTVQTEDRIRYTPVNYRDHDGNTVTVYQVQWAVQLAYGSGAAEFCITVQGE